MAGPISTGAISSAIASGAATGGGGGNKVFSIGTFIGAGLDQAGIFSVLGEAKEVLTLAANMNCGIMEMLANSRGGAESLFKRMTAIFKDKAEAWDTPTFAAFIDKNKDAIAGAKSPNWNQMAEDSQHKNAFNQNHNALQNFQPVQKQNNLPPMGYQPPFPYNNSGSSGSGNTGGGGNGGGSNHSIASPFLSSGVSTAGAQMYAAGMTGGGNVAMSNMGLFPSPNTPTFGGISGPGIGVK